MPKTKNPKWRMGLNEKELDKVVKAEDRLEVLNDEREDIMAILQILRSRGGARMVHEQNRNAARLKAVE